MSSSEDDNDNYTFVAVPPDSLTCGICLSVVKQPQQHEECGNLFCRRCTNKHREKNHNPKCPKCRGDFTTFNDARGARDVKALKIKCSNLKNGCQWVGELGSLRENLNKCGYQTVECENECASEKLQRKDLESHLANDCPFRDHTCPHCNKTGPYETQTTTHLVDCPMIVVECPNAKCTESIPRCNLQSHRSICEYEQTPCKFAKFGCEETKMRKEMKKHEENDKQHLQITKEKVLDLTETVQKQANEIRKLKKVVCTKDKPFTFKFQNHREHASESKAFSSPSFYSSQDGYKFTIKIISIRTFLPRMNEPNLDPNLDIYICIEKEDKLIGMPFEGTIRVHLLNQIEDRLHHKYITKFSKTGEHKLDYEKDLSRSTRDRTNYYNRSHELIFRVYVEQSNYKPWLECTI